ncbi:uncharacterized protein EKO05_0002652 [Ascochyta rabiei]|uniref:Uncharacterized protein n=1 Tax=Didymella rabiei TaxID=5454 RepID=A0A162ZQG4_DIDRA|nr:uncharacterized protein EKO05_0002652 [Ascochyta rabiei]KZM20751.1 hypothetical protein ST47_g8103 [Ascochyta rabiei]UPX12076.1 hypothetical protein EKO05_0002652 [Ascochyta rabiei]
MVQDPNFWRRFSVAVHNDEAAMLFKDSEHGQKETKHAYVVSLSSPTVSPVATPTSQCHLSPVLPATVFTRPISAPAFVSKQDGKDKQRSRATSGTKSVCFDANEDKMPEMIALHHLPSCPQLSFAPESLPSTPKSAYFAPDSLPSKRASRRASRFRFALSSHPPSLPPTPKSTHFPPSTLPSKRTSRRFTKNSNTSRLSFGLSLSGRSKSSFRFWTTVTADPYPRDSWLEGQKRKARQRAYMCWAFWMVFLVLIVGAIVVLVVLRREGII